MAICKYCEQEMNNSDSCIKMPVPTVDGPLDPIPYGGESQHAKEPPLPGQYHHKVIIGDPPRCHDAVCFRPAIITRDVIGKIARVVMNNL